MAESIHTKVQSLGDLELAILVCLVAREQCMISAESESNDDLKTELERICMSTFGLQSIVVECTSDTTVTDFNESIVLEVPNENEYDTPRSQSFGRDNLLVESMPSRTPSQTRFGSNTLDERRIADVIIARNFDLTTSSVQTQVLELIRTKRVFTRTAMHTASKDFMVIAVTSRPGARLSHHLNDLFCMSHVHADEGGFAYSHGSNSKGLMPHFTNNEIQDLRELAENTTYTPELAAYLHNIVVFMRNNRYIRGGVTATATRQLRAICKVLAPLHGLSYVPPSLVILAVRKIYPHRLILATVDTERSMQWGSDAEAVRQLLDGVTVEDAIEDVLVSVETPL